MLSGLLTAFKKYISKRKIIIKSSIYKMRNRTSTFSDKTILFRMANVSHSDIGKYTYIAGYANINNCTIGSFCSIADGVRVGVGAHPLNLISTHPALYSIKTIFPYKLIDDSIIDSLPSHEESKRINIGNDVWIGTDSIILDGVNIGDGAVIAAGSVVTKDIPSFAVVGGVPARVIKYRAIPEMIDGKPWWELQDAELSSYLNKIYKDNKKE
ncbi:CatB-related O-acetyltransferase [Aeromonas hydrophila]|uniref:CatB-related O-acetyltransferase n=1 Tax=Aeromonas hydrophila TaxID=644 RepID=UPI002B499A94|nr:CatB-related O-acetyltransferase [Aeromonas hydrophila]